MITTYNPTENTNIAEIDTFKITLPAESCGILKRGWQPADIKSMTVSIRTQDTAENGKLAAVVIDNEPTARLVRYELNTCGEIVLTDPNNYVYPFDQGEAPIVLTATEAATRLKVLGVVDRFYLELKERS